MSRIRALFCFFRHNSTRVGQILGLLSLLLVLYSMYRDQLPF